MSEPKAFCALCRQRVAVIEPGYMLTHYLPHNDQVCMASGTNDYYINLDGTLSWRTVRPKPAAPGQVWRDLSNPGRTLTINFIFERYGVRYANCTSYTPRQKRLKLTNIRADRFGPHRVWIKMRQEYRDKGFERMELAYTYIWPTQSWKGR